MNVEVSPNARDAAAVCGWETAAGQPTQMVDSMHDVMDSAPIAFAYASTSGPRCRETVFTYPGVRPLIVRHAEEPRRSLMHLLVGWFSWSGVVFGNGVGERVAVGRGEDGRGVGTLRALRALRADAGA